MDPRQRFTAAVTDYDRHRPTYPDALIAWLLERSPGRRAVELGSGTGILSRQLAAAGFAVLGIEPNAAMRAAADRQGGGPVYQAGEAEATGLNAGCADLVIGAQAFHWFDLERTLPEIDRVGVPGALAVAVWNLRVSEGFGLAYDEAIRAFSGSYGEVAKPGPTLARLREMRPEGFAAKFSHAQMLDLDGVLGRAWSSSYVVHGVTDRERFDEALRGAFSEHAIDGRVALRYETVLWGWRVPDSNIR